MRLTVPAPMRYGSEMCKPDSRICLRMSGRLQRRRSYGLPRGRSTNRMWVRLRLHQQCPVRRWRDMPVQDRVRDHRSPLRRHQRVREDAGRLRSERHVHQHHRRLRVPLPVPIGRKPSKGTLQRCLPWCQLWKALQMSDWRNWSFLRLRWRMDLQS